MKKRVTIEFNDDDILYNLFMQYISDNYLTITSAIKQAITELLRSKNLYDI